MLVATCTLQILCGVINFGVDGSQLVTLSE